MTVETAALWVPFATTVLEMVVNAMKLGSSPAVVMNEIMIEQFYLDHVQIKSYFNN